MLSTVAGAGSVESSHIAISVCLRQASPEAWLWRQHGVQIVEPTQWLPLPDSTSSPSINRSTPVCLLCAFLDPWTAARWIFLQTLASPVGERSVHAIVLDLDLQRLFLFWAIALWWCSIVDTHNNTYTHDTWTCKTGCNWTPKTCKCINTHVHTHRLNPKLCLCLLRIWATGGNTKMNWETLVFFGSWCAILRNPQTKQFDPQS